MIQSAAVVIPAYRPSERLVKLVEEISLLNRKKEIERIIIIDDGSGYDYQSIFNYLESYPNVILLRHAINLGKGAALKTAFNHILIHYPRVMTLVTADADGQHLPQDIWSLISLGVEQPDNLLLGTRKFDKNVPFRSRFGNQITRFIMRFFTGLQLADTQTGLRAWPRYLACQVLRITINGYDFEMECLIRAKKLLGKQGTIIEVPISTVYIEDNKSSHFNPLLDSMRIYFVFLRYCGASLLTALVDNIVFIMAFSAHGNIAQSQIMARGAGAFVSFILSRQLVFHSSVNWLYGFIKLLFLVILFGFISYGLISYLHTYWGVSVIFAKLLAELILFVASFAIQREFIFSK